MILWAAKLRQAPRRIAKALGDQLAAVMPRAAGDLAADNLGRMAARKFHVTTFGCQMNEHDSERMKGMLESLGYQEAHERAGADLILFNTCSIREKADDRFIAHLAEANALKRRSLRTR